MISSKSVRFIPLGVRKVLLLTPCYAVTKQTAVVDHILNWAKAKQSKELSKTDGKKKGRLSGIPKLEDANDAGTKNGKNCTLILTEGDSAKVPLFNDVAFLLYVTESPLILAGIGSQWSCCRRTRSIRSVSVARKAG